MIVKYAIYTRSDEPHKCLFKESKINKVTSKYHNHVCAILIVNGKKVFLKKSFDFALILRMLLVLLVL